MPKVVDHVARRHDIAQAYWRVVRRDGVAAATVRAVASEAGMTAGAMRHYFDGHEGLQGAAMAAMVERIRERVQVAGAVPGSALERGAHVLRELLPLDDERQAEAEVWFAFVAAARFDSTFGPLADESYDMLRGLVAAIVSALLPNTQPGHRELETERLFALVDGLALHAVQRRGAPSPARMAAVLDAHLTALVAAA